MGAHYNQQIHKRAAAAKQRRLAADEADDALLKSLIARFSPTAIYTETETFPPPTDPVTTDTPADTPTTTPPPPPPPPTTTPPAPPTTPTNTPPANTDTTPPPAQQTTTNLPPAGQQTNANTNTNVVTTPPVVNTSPVATPPTRTSLTTQAPASITSSASSSTPSPESGTNVGGIVGGIAGALLGLAVLIFIVRFVMNRQRRKHDEDSAAGFNANDFRRSAVLMNDPPTHHETVERGFNPRPPTMVQRRLASPAPTFGTQYGAPGPYGATGGTEYGTEYGNMDQYGQYQSYGPGQVMNNMSPPVTATSAHPMYPNAAYGQSPFSPIGSPVSATGPGYDGGQTAILTRQPSSATQLSRQPSAGGANGYPQDDRAQFATYHNQGNLSAPNEYVELDRSSVTPYQAAQYAEISKRLNTDVPAGLDTPAVNQFVQSSNEGAPPVPANVTASPFADPIPAALLAGGGAGAKDARPTSTDSVTRDLDNFPTPPSPAHSSRVDSSPPMLPEILVESQVASYDFPVSVRGSPLGSGYPSGVTKDFNKSPLGSQFPATPSPMASSFDITSPPAVATSFPAAEPAPAPATEVKADQKKRPDTVYDDDDAYGGI